MTKEKYIAKYGMEKYEAFKTRQREYAKKHPQPGDRHSEGYYRRRYLRLKEQKAKEKQK